MPIDNQYQIICHFYEHFFFKEKPVPDNVKHKTITLTFKDHYLKCIFIEVMYTSIILFNLIEDFTWG